MSKSDDRKSQPIFENIDLSLSPIKSSKGSLKGLVLIPLGIIVFTSLLYSLGLMRFPNFRQEQTVALLLIVFATVVWVIMAWRLRPVTFEQRKDFIDLYAKILGAVIVIIGTFFTWYNIKRTQETTAANLALANQTLANQRANRISEEFLRANEKLRDTNSNARVAAILSLERLADEIAGEYTEVQNTNLQINQKNEQLDKLRRDYLRIIYVLTTFIHDFAPLKKETTKDQPSKGSTEDIIDDCESIVAVDTPKDIQAAMGALGKRRLTYMNGEGGKEQRLGLYEVDLRGVTLVDNENFDGASFRGSNLEGARLRNASLKNALFSDAKLRGVNFAGADLEGADLRGADLACANLATAKCLTMEQLKLANNFDKATLPYYLRYPGQGGNPCPTAR
ncbi:MAG TPA: pentapeptide repeat-containing protein [Pyrinomonadaceae bacterium]|nr:pentapeptide repeat-containing protein [Pyrinomonadaceae bacterium]